MLKQIIFLLLFFLFLGAWAAEYPPTDPPPPITFTYSQKIVSSFSNQPMTGVRGIVTFTWKQQLVSISGERGAIVNRSIDIEGIVDANGYLKVSLQKRMWEGPYFDEDWGEYWYKITYPTFTQKPKKLYFCTDPVLQSSVYYSEPTSSWISNQAILTEYGINQYLILAYDQDLLPHGGSTSITSIVLGVPVIDIQSGGTLKLHYPFSGVFIEGTSYSGYLEVSGLSAYYDYDSNLGEYVVGVAINDINFAANLNISAPAYLQEPIKISVEQIFKVKFVVVIPVSPILIGVGTEGLFTEIQVTRINAWGGTNPTSDGIRADFKSRWVIGR